jgi:hypothetical protein
MIFRVAREGAEIGQFSEEEFRDKIFTGNIKPGDHYWTEGMEDWHLVSDYRGLPSPSGPPTLPPLPRMPEKKKARTESPASIGGACALVAAFAPLLSPSLFFILSLPLLFAAFVLAIVSLVRGRVTGGICLLVGLFPALMMAFVALTERDKLLNRQHQSRQVSVRPSAALQAVGTKQSQAAAVEATPSPPPEPDQRAKVPTDGVGVEPTGVSPPQLVTITQSVSVPLPYGTTVLPVGTRLAFVSRDGSDVRIRYAGGEYTIPISATDLK